jgi:LAO/AO transport system kinase
LSGAGDKKEGRYYADGIGRGDRALLARAITLVESSKPEHQALAREIFSCLPVQPPDTFRLGLTGVPGVGKSTFIETYGRHVLRAGHKLAVLAIDPSSVRTGGSILGDKTRMTSLSTEENVYIRPSPSAGALGGVAKATYGAIRLCEAAGFNYVIVETVGVGQSEVAVSRITDFFLLLMLAGAGDELQGIKRGIMEMADALVITKADGGNERRAAAARTEFAQAMHLLQLPESGWRPPVLTCSAIEDRGVAEVFAAVEKYKPKMTASGYFMANRRRQQLQLLEDTLRSEVLSAFYQRMDLHARFRELAAGNRDFDPFTEVSLILKQAGLA